MSYQAIDAVLRHSKSKGAARLLLLCIAHHADESGANSFPGIETLSHEAAIDSRRVRRTVRELEEEGELRTDIGGGRKANSYTILLPMDPVFSPGTGAPSGAPATGLGAPAALAPAPSQNTVTGVVGSVGLNTNNNIGQNAIGRAQLLEALQLEGVRADVAVDLVTRTPERILPQLAYLGEREPRDRAAVLVDSIKGNWKPPAAFLKREAEEKKRRGREEREQLKREEEERRQIEEDAKKKKQAEDEERGALENARLDALYEALSPEEKARVDAQVEEMLRDKPLFMRTGFSVVMARRVVMRGK